MAGFSKFRPGFRRAATDAAPEPVVIQELTKDENGDAVETQNGATGPNGEPLEVVPSEDAQRGVRDVEAVPLTWSKKTLAAVFVWYVPFASIIKR